MQASLAEVLTEHLKSPRVTSGRTGDRYRDVIKNFELWLGRPGTIADLTLENWRTWISFRREVSEVATGTIHGEAEKLLALWRTAAWLAGFDPPRRVQLPPSASTKPVAWSDSEFTALMNACYSCKRRIGGIPGKVYWPALIGVLFDSGERIAAVHAMTVGDVDLKNRVVHFPMAGRKGGRSDNHSEICEETAKDLERLIAVSPRLFQVIKRNSLYPPFRMVIAEAGLPVSRVRSFHCLRRTTATACVKQGIDPTAKLDHDDPRTTRKHYVDTTKLGSMLPQRPNSKKSWRQRFFG